LKLLTERGIEADHVTVYRWVQRFTPLLVGAARPCRHAGGDRWFVDETYVKIAGRWRYVYRAIDQVGQVIDVFVEADHGRLKVRLGPMRGLRQDRNARIVTPGTPSSRTSGEATTSLRSRRQRTGEWRSPSTNSPSQSDPEARPGFQHAAGWHNATDPPSVHP
jgi:transposase-like protein